MRGKPSERGADALSGGELNAAVTRELVRIHTAAIGRGPRKSYSFHSGDTLLTVMLGPRRPSSPTVRARPCSPCAGSPSAPWPRR
jgi:hypothetical protein